MCERINDTYQSWEDSWLAKKIITPRLNNRLRDIWIKANEGYPRATWSGWIDHSAAHILNVLRNLDRMIPKNIYQVIQEDEAFVLIVACLLHDIGMISEGNDSVDLQYIVNLRMKHGEKADEVIKAEFKELLDPAYTYLYPVCEIVKNHHGKFNPSPIEGLGYNLRANALWVRLADELDFGRHRAPAWLLDYIRPTQKNLEHWLNHNNIDEPSIDLNLFRIQIRGVVENEAFVRKLRLEFENTERQELQKLFLNRGTQKSEYDQTFIIWDLTKRKPSPGDDSKEIDTRPPIFLNDQYFQGARFLYNLGKYDTAVKCFEKGVDLYSGGWLDSPAIIYFYHYLKCLHALGEHKKALQIAERYRDANFSQDMHAAIAAANGLGHWKLGNFDLAIEYFTMAVALYESLSQRDSNHKLNAADAYVLKATTNLEKLRTSNLKGSRKLEPQICSCIKQAENQFKEYEQERHDLQESHYKGRYWGLMAFHCLLQFDLDKKLNKDLISDQWSDVLGYASKSHGGKHSANRNPFGFMCGKYCAAAVLFYKYRKENQELDLRRSAEMIRDVRTAYDDIYGPKQRIYRTWNKIHYLFIQIQRALPKKYKNILSDFNDGDSHVRKTEIYTPLH